jgi:hypothetical protein
MQEDATPLDILHQGEIVAAIMSRSSLSSSY